MNNEAMKAEAVKLLAAFDEGSIGMYCEERTASALSEYWIEWQFARIDVDCDWSDAKCLRMGKRMEAALRGLSVTP